MQRIACEAMGVSRRSALDRSFLCANPNANNPFPILLNLLVDGAGYRILFRATPGTIVSASIGKRATTFRDVPRKVCTDPIWFVGPVSRVWFAGFAQ